MTEPYLIAGIRTMPEHMTSPPQVAFSNWLVAEGIDRTRGSSITVWAEIPIRAEFTLFELDGDGHPIVETIYVSTLPPLQGVATGDPT